MSEGFTEVNFLLYHVNFDYLTSKKFKFFVHFIAFSYLYYDFFGFFVHMGERML